MAGRVKAIVIPILGKVDPSLAKAFDEADGIVAGLGPKVAAAGLAAGAALGGALIKGTLDAMDQGAVVDRLGSSLGLSDAEATALGKTAGDLYTDAYGSSFENVADTLRTAVSVDIPTDQLETITGQAFSMESAFGGVASEYIVMADTFAEQGLVDSAAEGLDFIATAFQGLPAEMQGPLLEAANEYGGFMQDLGFSTEQTFGLLSSAAAEGEFALDKTGDALKEFSIRATDGSTASSAAYEAIGLDATKMSNDLLAGGDTASAAFDQIVDGLLSIEDPTERANASIALFGTPLEDLGVNGIPDFLSGLQNMDEGFQDVGGAAGDLDSQLNDNLKTQFESFKRQAFQGLADVATKYLIPAIETTVEVFRQISDWVRDNQTLVIGAMIGITAAFAAWAVQAGIAAVANFTFAGSVLAAALPFVAFAAAVAALAAGLLWAYDNVEWFRTAVDAVAGFLSGTLWPILKTVVSWVGDKLVSAVQGAAGFFTGTLVPAVSGIIGWFGDLIGKAGEVVGSIRGGFDDLVGFVTGLPERITSAASGMFNGIQDAFRSAVNWIIGKWNDLEFTIGGGSFAGVDFPSMTLGTPDIPKLHTGGVVPGYPGQERLYLLEAGETVRTRDQEASLGGFHIENLYVTERNLLDEFVELEARYGVLV